MNDTIKVGILEKDGIEYDVPVEYPITKLGQDLKGLVPHVYDSTLFMSSEWKTKVCTVATQTVDQALTSTATAMTLGSIVEEDPDATEVETGDTLKVLKEDTYEVTYKVLIKQVGSNTRSEAEMYLEVDIGSGFSKVVNSSTYIYSRQSSQGKGSSHSENIITLPVGSMIRVMVRRSAGSGTLFTIADESSLTIKQSVPGHSNINFGVISKEWTPDQGDNFDFVFTSQEWTI